MSSRGVVVWCVGRWTYRGSIVATTIFGVVFPCEADRTSALVVQRVESSSCEAGSVSALVVLRTVVSRLLRSLTSEQLGSVLCTAREELSWTSTLVLILVSWRFVIKDSLCVLICWTSCVCHISPLGLSHARSSESCHVFTATVTALLELSDTRTFERNPVVSALAAELYDSSNVEIDRQIGSLG